MKKEPWVLVVDDDADVRRLIAEVLALNGVRATTAGSGVEALELLATGPRPDLLLLDVQMPEMDGWDTLRVIRSTPSTATLPVVLCTVKSGPIDLSHGLRLGCDGYVVKPFSIEDLLDEVKRVLGALSLRA